MWEYISLSLSLSRHRRFLLCWVATNLFDNIILLNLQVATHWPGRVTTPNSHSSEQGTLLIVSLISKQAIPYQTRGGTYCPGVSTSITRSLADSSMTNHITWWIPTIFTIPNLAQTTASNLTMVTSHHDGWKTNALNIPQVKLNIIKMDRLAQHSRLHD
jgi:hypothetical protein